MFEGFVEWLRATSLSAFLSDTTNFWTWLIIPISQSIHILGVAVVMTAMGMLNLKLLGFAVSRQSFGRLTADLMPWLWSALIVLFLTGTIQTIAEPGRQLLNIGFKTKMVLLALVLPIMMLYEGTGRKDPYYWERSPARRKTAYALAGASLVLWFGIATAGRLVAYLL